MGGCLTRLVLLPLIIAAIYPLLLLRSPFPTFVFPAEGAEATAVIAGFSLWFAVISLLDIRRFTSDLALLNKSFLREGERTIVSGCIETKAALLKAPFSGEDCLGYYYVATHTTTSSGSSSTKWTDYEGYALIPSIIRSPLGDLKILAEPSRELFYEVPSSTPDAALERAEEYLGSVEFAEEKKGPGDFRSDQMIGKKKDPKDCDFEQKIVRPGETILLSGVYSAAQEGLAPDPDSIMRPFHLIPGGEAALKRKQRNRWIAISICTAISSGAIAFYYLSFLPALSNG